MNEENPEKVKVKESLPSKRPSTKSDILGFRHMIATFRHSIDGICACVGSEVAFRHELVLGVVMCIAIIALPISMLVRMYFIALWFVLISVELVNTAIEAIVDMVSPEWNEKAKLAKDLGGAAVLCILVAILVSWIIIIVHLCR